MYHRIAEESFDPWGLAVAPAHFAAQIQWLATNRIVMPLAEFAARHHEHRLPREAVALTFDDAYECAAQVAAPLLERAGLPATIFIPAALIERGDPFWWDELRLIVLGHDCDRLRLQDQEFVLGTRHADDREWKPDAPPQTARQAAFQRIWATLREKPPNELDEAMAQLRGQVRMAEATDVALPMSVAQVRETASDLIEFGSHALTHPWLTSLTHAQKRREIGDSVERVESLTGRRPTSFAYPYGNFDAQAERIVQETGFACACATLGRTVGPESRLSALPRVQVGNWDSRRLARVLAAI